MRKVQTLKSLLAFCLIFALLLSGCGNKGIVPTAHLATPIVASKAALPVSPSATPEKKVSATAINSETKQTSTPTLTPTPKCDSIAQLPLAEAILQPTDMLKSYPIFESENRWTSSADLTKDLLNNKNCLLDCAKQVWSPVTVSIVLIKSSGPERASRLIEETRKTFTNILEITDRPYLSDLSPNVWSAYYYPRNEFVLLYSYGSLFVFIVNRPVPGFDDFAGEFDLTYALGDLQREKLCSSGYTP